MPYLLNKTKKPGEVEKIRPYKRNNYRKITTNVKIEKNNIAPAKFSKVARREDIADLFYNQKLIILSQQSSKAEQRRYSLKMKSRDVYIGIGFHTDVRAKEMEQTIRRFLEDLEIALKEVKGLCTVDFRNTDELQEVSTKLGIPLLFFSRDEINSVEVQSKSAATDALNLKGVAEPCAILGAKRNKEKSKFLKRKSYDRKITLAVVR